MELKTVIQFTEGEKELIDIEKMVKEFAKDKKIKLKEIKNVEAYVKPEATYVVLNLEDRQITFVC